MSLLKQPSSPPSDVSSCEADLRRNARGAGAGRRNLLHGHVDFEVAWSPEQLNSSLRAESVESQRRAPYLYRSL